MRAQLQSQSCRVCVCACARACIFSLLCLCVCTCGKLKLNPAQRAAQVLPLVVPECILGLMCVCACACLSVAHCTGCNAATPSHQRRPATTWRCDLNGSEREKREHGTKHKHKHALHSMRAQKRHETRRSITCSVYRAHYHTTDTTFMPRLSVELGSVGMSVLVNEQCVYVCVNMRAHVQTA